eukprot:m.8150 g.8150  ORF g.8150 m.8150 type:complete len:225 (+) comp20357_c0_seq1:557-1231(+)
MIRRCLVSVSLLLAFFELARGCKHRHEKTTYAVIYVGKNRNFMIGLNPNNSHGLELIRVNASGTNTSQYVRDNAWFNVCINKSASGSTIKETKVYFQSFVKKRCIGISSNGTLQQGNCSKSVFLQVPADFLKSDCANCSFLCGSRGGKSWVTSVHLKSTPKHGKKIRRRAYDMEDYPNACSSETEFKNAAGESAEKAVGCHFVKALTLREKINELMISVQTFTL